MKKLSLLLCSGLLMFFFSCSSSDLQDENVPKGDKELVPFSLNTKIWTQSVEPMKTKSSANNYYPDNIDELRNEIRWIQYFVYEKESGAFVKQDFIYSETPLNDLTIRGSIAKGNYKVIVVAKQRAEKFHGDTDPGVETNLATATLKRANLGHHFYGEFDIDVNDAPIVNDVVLKRVTGELEIVILDAKEIFGDNVEAFKLEYAQHNYLQLHNGFWAGAYTLPEELNSIAGPLLLDADVVPYPYCIIPTDPNIAMTPNHHVSAAERGKLKMRVEFKNARPALERIIDMPLIYPNSVTKITGSLNAESELELSVEYQKVMGQIFEVAF